MAAEASREDLPKFEGELVTPPRGPLLTAALAITGILLVLELARLIAKYVLSLKRPTEVRLSASGLDVRGRTSMIGKVLREYETVIPRDGLVRATREVRYPSLAMYAGLIALALGSYLGIGLAVDGVRAASPSMLGTGLLIALLGLGLDFALTSVVPSVKGKSRVVLVPRRGPILCVAEVDPAHADVVLATLSGAPRPKSEAAPPAVKAAAGTDLLAGESEDKRAEESR
jgi:hypothetical protein